MIKAIIFDLNGIFVTSPKLSDRFAADFGVPIATFLPKLSEIMNKVRQPNAGPSFQYWEPVLAEWGVKLSEQQFWDYWFKTEQTSNEIVEFTTSLRNKGIKIFILSNNFKERADYYSHYPWLRDAVDKVYFSWQTGLVKPNPEAWINVLKENNLAADECLYFDDQEKNLKAAESIGIKSFMFTTADDLKRIVENI